MFRFPSFLTHWLFWLRTTLIGIVLCILFIQGETFLVSQIPQPPIQTAPNAPASFAIKEFTPQTSTTKTHASYLFQEALLQTPSFINEIIPPTPKPKPRPKPLPYYEKYVPVPKGVSPNSVRLHISQVPPIAGEVKMVNGRPTCPKKNDKSKKSKVNKRAHIDRECCLDPDEVPHPRCAY